MGGLHKTKLSANCIVCGRIFWRRAYFIRALKQAFCSMKCRNTGKFNPNYKGSTKTNYQRKLESIARHPEKHKAREKLEYQFKMGYMEREECMFAHEGNCVHTVRGVAEAAHWDYERPLEPVYLCRRHHIDVDKYGKPLALPISLASCSTAA